MSDQIDLETLFAEMDRAADRAERALEGRYADIYRGLRNLTPDEIDDITPDTRDQKEYERLMALVQEASAHNMDQARLVERIHALGDTATRIARRVPGLAGLV